MSTVLDSMQYYSILHPPVGPTLSTVRIWEHSTETDVHCLDSEQYYSILYPPVGPTLSTVRIWEHSTETDVH